MNCKNCGNILFEKDTFCTKCGTPVDRTSTPVQQPVNPEPVQQPTYQQPTMEQPQQPVNPQPMYQQPVNNYQQPMYNQPSPKKKTNPLMFVLAGIGLVVLLAIVMLIIVAKSSKDFVCTSDQGSITLYYNKNAVIGYSAQGFTYDLDGQQELSKQKGIDQYLDEFNQWFVSTTNGKCTKDGVAMPSSSQTSTPEPTPTPEPTTTPTTNSNRVSYKGRTYTLPAGWIGEEVEGLLAIVTADSTKIAALGLEGPVAATTFAQFKQHLPELADVLREGGKIVKNSGTIKTVGGLEFIVFEIEYEGYNGLYIVCQDPNDQYYIYEGQILYYSGAADYGLLSDVATIVKSGKSSSSSFSTITKDFEMSNFGKVKASFK